jgi:hypothetical protein
LQSLEFANAKFDLAFKNEVTTDDIRAGRLVQIGATDPALHPVVLVWGDSHAVAAMPAIDAFLKEKGLAGLAATHSDTAPVLDWYKVRFWGLGKDSVIYGDTIVSYVQTHEIPNVILVAHWGEYIDASGSDGDSSVSLNSALLATVRRLVAAGSRPWVMLEVPNHSFDIPRALSHPIYSRAEIEALCSKPNAGNELDKDDPDLIPRLESAGARVLDPKPRFLDPEGRCYVIEANGIALYRDNHHLTTKGAQLLLLPFLRDSFTVGE